MNEPEEAPVRRVPWWQVVAVGRDPKVTAIRMFVTVVIAVVVFRSTIVPVRVTGISMQPTFKDGRRLYLWRLGPWSTPIERSDVLSVRMAGESVMVLKRVVALPGERVAIRRGHVFINGAELDEPYLASGRAPWNYPTDAPERVVPEDHYLLIGDNRTMHESMHVWGLVEKSRLVGKLRR